ncbi:MAG TPA: hypothetical protein EYN11_05605, partial [Phycisphaerales bacterium]|nr:hypothetical protein [Phycisphaerales bacterium]
MGTTAIRTQGRRLKGPSSLTSADLKLRILWISSAAIALLVAVALLSFDVGDAPSHVVATHNDPISNWCGAVGAWTAYWTYHVLGFGIWVLIVGLSCWVTLVFRGREITHTSIRALGFLIMAIAISCFHDLLFPNIGSLAGAKAGLIAKTIVTQLTTSFSNFGAFIIVLVAFSIGLVVGAEKIAFSIPHFIWNAILRTTKIRAPKFAVPTLPFIRFERGAVLEQDVEVEEEWEEEYAEDEYEDDEYEDDEEEYEDEKEPRKRLTAAELKKKMAKLPVR